MSVTGGETYDYLSKVLLIGESGVGKTALLNSFTAGEFKDDMRATVGVDLKVKLMSYHNKKIKLQIWDTAGQERFRTLTGAYYRGAHGIILVYAIDQRSSFDNLAYWLKECEMYAPSEAVLMLVGNKSDLPDEERQVPRDEGRIFAREKGMLFIEASAKTKEGVAQAFDELVQKIVDEPNLLQGDDQRGGAKGAVKVDRVEDDEDRPTQPAGCC